MTNDNSVTLHPHKPGVARIYREVPVCDFCLQTGAAGYYRVQPRRVELAPVRVSGRLVPFYDQDGEWNACQTCHDLIEAGDFEGLIERVRQENVHDPEVVGSEERLRKLYSQWRAARGSSPFIPEPVN